MDMSCSCYITCFCFIYHRSCCISYLSSYMLSCFLCRIYAHLNFSSVKASCLSLYMQISIWVSSISFHAYADIAYQSSSDVSNGVQLPLMGDKDRFMVFLPLFLVVVICLCYKLFCCAYNFLLLYIILIGNIICYKGGKGITDLKSALQVFIN